MPYVPFEKFVEIVDFLNLTSYDSTNRIFHLGYNCIRRFPYVINSEITRTYGSSSLIIRIYFSNNITDCLDYTRREYFTVFFPEFYSYQYLTPEVD